MLGSFCSLCLPSSPVLPDPSPAELCVGKRHLCDFSPGVASFPFAWTVKWITLIKSWASTACKMSRAENPACNPACDRGWALHVTVPSRQAVSPSCRQGQVCLEDDEVHLPLGVSSMDFASPWPSGMALSSRILRTPIIS